MTTVEKSISTAANIIEATLAVLKKINPDYVEIPASTNEITNDIQASMARKVGAQ